MPVNYIPHPIQAIGNQFLPGGRALNTDYQNLTLRPILVIITTQHTTVANNDCRVIYYTGLAGWPVMNWVTSAGYVLAAPIGVALHCSVSFLVAPGEYYHARQDDAGGNVSALNRWWEINL